MEHPTPDPNSMDIDFSPTGEEFVTAGLDRSVRLFRCSETASRDVYYQRRMERRMARVFSVRYSMDDMFVFSGSDDANIRQWKARASEKLGDGVTGKERGRLREKEALKAKYRHLPEIKRILRYVDVCLDPMPLLAKVAPQSMGLVLFVLPVIPTAVASLLAEVQLCDDAGGMVEGMVTKPSDDDSYHCSSFRHRRLPRKIKGDQLAMKRHAAAERRKEERRKENQPKSKAKSAASKKRDHPRAKFIVTEQE